MQTEYILLFAATAVIAILYYFVIAPRKQMKAFVDNFRSRGYKVYEIPFRAFKTPIVDIKRRDFNQTGDALNFIKTVESEVDVVVANSVSKVGLELTHSDLIKDFSSVQHLYTYPKLMRFHATVSLALGKGLVFSEGESWKRKRRIISSVFNFDLIKSMSFEIEKICAQTITQMETDNPCEDKDYFEYNVLDLTASMFSNVILKCFLGKTDKQLIDGKPAGIFMVSLISDLILRTYDREVAIFGNKFPYLGLRAKDREINRRLAIYKQWGQNFVKKRMAEINEMGSSQNPEEPKDIIQALMMNNRKQTDKENIYTDQEIFEEFTIFFMAGTDTTSHYLGMMIYYIALTPYVEQKLRMQIDEIMKDDDYSYDNLKKMTYIDDIQRETMRMYGPGTTIFTRESIEDTFIDKVPIPKGTLLSINHLGNHYSERYFKTPLQFRPERWDGECDNLPLFAYGGFGVGGRSCIGKQLAILESKIGLVKFMKRYNKIELPIAKISELKMAMGLVYTPVDFKSKLYPNK